MKYLIKSPYWSRHYKKDTYWGPNKNGYTTNIFEAGIYDESEKEPMERLNTLDRCTFVPLTEKLVKKGIKQVEKKVQETEHDIVSECFRHSEALNHLDKRMNHYKEGFNKLMKLKGECMNA